MRANDRRDRIVAMRRMTLQTLYAIAASGGVFYDALGAFDGCGCYAGCDSLAMHVQGWAVHLPRAVATSYEDACARKAFILETVDVGERRIRGYRLARLGGGEKGTGHLYSGETLPRDPDEVWKIMRTIEDLYTHPACKRDTEAKPSRSIVVLGRRWFDRRAGNTYHTATIIVDGRNVHTSDRSYGYDDGYLDTAARWLESEGIVKRERYAASGGVESLPRACERMGIVLSYQACDVARKTDL